MNAELYLPIHDLSVSEFQHRLSYGDPTVGWSGDPDMAVVHHPDGWAIARLDQDLTWRVLLTASRHARLDTGVLRMLADRYQHRDRDPYNPVEAVIAQNKATYKAKAYAAQQAEGEASDMTLSAAGRPLRTYTKDRPVGIGRPKAT